MKLCILLAVKSSHTDASGVTVADDVDFVEMSIVDDEHKFGWDEFNGQLFHYESRWAGSRPIEEVAADGTAAD